MIGSCCRSLALYRCLHSCRPLRLLMPLLREGHREELPVPSKSLSLWSDIHCRSCYRAGKLLAALLLIPAMRPWGILDAAGDSPPDGDREGEPPIPWVWLTLCHV